MRLNKRFY